MKYRQFGKTELVVSEIGFGAWAIGGSAMAGNVAIGWGHSDDQLSRDAIRQAVGQGINFFDTADFYGLGHSETLLGEVLSELSEQVLIATKVGHQLATDGSIHLNYKKNYIISACEASLKRLRRECIDLYQLHSAKITHLENGESIEAMELLKQQGKIRYWGLSLNTYQPEPESRFLMERGLADSFQVVLNLINQNGLEYVIPTAAEKGYGLIARMPLQFGLLTGKFTKDTRFQPDDHRTFRLAPVLLDHAIDALFPVWEMAYQYHLTPAQLAFGFILSHPEISTIIPGMRTPRQVIENSQDALKLNEKDLDFLHHYFKSDLFHLLEEMKQLG